MLVEWFSLSFVFWWAGRPIGWIWPRNCGLHYSICYAKSISSELAKLDEEKDDKTKIEFKHNYFCTPRLWNPPDFSDAYYNWLLAMHLLPYVTDGIASVNYDYIQNRLGV